MRFWDLAYKDAIGVTLGPEQPTQRTRSMWGCPACLGLPPGRLMSCPDLQLWVEKEEEDEKKTIARPQGSPWDLTLGVAEMPGLTTVVQKGWDTSPPEPKSF